METQMNIPKRVNVGFRERNDTYTKKLAYIIYWDQKGVLRKEPSWNSWRDKEIPNEEFDNEPTSGFVLNKNGGGARNSYGWNARNEFVRVYDPRGFEFEIGVANLLYILQETSSIKGKGLEGEFVYAWWGAELVLMPVGTEEYKASKAFTDLQSKKLTVKDIMVGCEYKSKKDEHWVYMGRMPFYEEQRGYDGFRDYTAKHKHVYAEIEPDGKFKGFVGIDGYAKLAVRLTDEPDEEKMIYLKTQLQETHHGKKFSHFETRPLEWVLDTNHNDDHERHLSYGYLPTEDENVFKRYYLFEYKYQNRGYGYFSHKSEAERVITEHCVEMGDITVKRDVPVYEGLPTDDMWHYSGYYGGYNRDQCRSPKFDPNDNNFLQLFMVMTDGSKIRI